MYIYSISSCRSCYQAERKKLGHKSDDSEAGTTTQNDILHVPFRIVRVQLIARYASMTFHDVQCVTGKGILSTQRVPNHHFTVHLNIKLYVYRPRPSLFNVQPCFIHRNNPKFSRSNLRSNRRVQGSWLFLRSSRDRGYVCAIENGSRKHQAINSKTINPRPAKLWVEHIVHCALA